MSGRTFVCVERPLATAATRVVNRGREGREKWGHVITHLQPAGGRGKERRRGGGEGGATG